MLFLAAIYSDSRPCQSCFPYPSKSIFIILLTDIPMISFLCLKCRSITMQKIELHTMFEGWSSLSASLFNKFFTELSTAMDWKLTSSSVPKSWAEPIHDSFCTILMKILSNFSNSCFSSCKGLHVLVSNFFSQLESIQECLKHWF